MSRTFRMRKPNRQGKRTVCYLARMFYSHENLEHLSKREAYEKRRWKTGESFNRSIPKGYRKARNKQNRMINKTQLYKWVMVPEYEPIFEPNPRSALWDWL